MIKPGTLKSVSMAYGNHRQEVIAYFLAHGWEFSSEVKGNYNVGDHHDFITFRAGVGAKEIIQGWGEGKFDFPNAHLVK